MSLESSAPVAPLQFEVWHEIKVKADPDSWLPPYPLHNTNFYFKFVHDSAAASFCLIITDLCFVWLTRVEQRTIDAEMKRFNPSIRKKTTNHTITMLEELLRDNNQSQFHLVKLIEAGSSNGGSGSMSSRASAAAASGSAASSSSTPALQLQSSMSLGGVITFRWTFQCHSYGSALDQCTFLRAQMYLPLHEMIKILSFQLEREKRKNQLLSAGGGGAAAAASSGGGGLHHHHAAAAAGGNDVSLSLSFPSLSSAEREAQLAALGGAGGGGGVGGGGVAAANLQSFDAFSSAFHFSQHVGPLYVGVVNRLSGNEDLLGLDPAAPGASQLPPASWDGASLRPGSPNWELERKADEEGAADSKLAGRAGAAARRGTKRDRDRSVSPRPSAAVAFPPAHSSGGERDPDLDYKHQEDDSGGYGGGYPSPSFPAPSFDGTAAASASHAGASGVDSSLDIGGHVDEDGVYHETEAERMRRETLQRQLSQQKKKKKKKMFV